jgi:hypothetical protein
MNAAKNKCSCGGACGCDGGCDSRCCDLECLQRPNFYCGQLLTDADLAAMVDWTRGRLGLSRFRHGWGIVCGLELSCTGPGGASSCGGDKPASAGPAVYLNSGYAVDCCGDDLVVCEPIRVDLAPLCRPPSDPCDPAPRPAQPNGANGDGDADGAAEQDCLRIPPEELFAVQLSLRYHEDLAQGQRALFRGSCADDGPCQYARVLERPCVHLDAVPLGQKQDGLTDEDRWLKDFRRGLAQQVGAIGTAVRKGSDAVLQNIRHNPPYRFCYLEETVCCLRRDETPNTLTSPQRWLEIAKLLMLDWTLRQLACPCPACLPDNGVPLGRVVLRRRVVAGRTQCSVVMIDQDAAYRRALRKTACRPLDAASRDLAAFLGQPVGRLQELGKQGLKFNIADAPATDPEQLGAMLDSFSGSVIAFDPATTGTLDVHLVDDIAGNARIALFVSRTPP